MSWCARCGKYFSVTRQTDYCPECEYPNMHKASNCDMPAPQGFGEQKGWICPVCGRGVAPWVDYCPCQINKNITWVTGTGTTTYTNLDAKEFEKYATTNCEELKL